MSTSNLGPGNIARTVYDPSLDAIKVSIVGSGSPSLPNVTRLSDGVGYISSTVSGPYRALDVNIINEMEIAVSHTEDSVALGDGTNTVSVTPAASGSVGALDTVDKATVFTKPFDTLEVLTKNDDGDPLTIQSRYTSNNVQLATITYDVDGDFQSVIVSDY